MSSVQVDFFFNSDDVQAALKPGDTVLLRGTVKEIRPGVGVEVELFSKTDQYTTPVRFGVVAALELPTPPPEPADRTWLIGRGEECHERTFYRNDADSPDRGGHAGRWPRNWWDCQEQQFITWPEAVRRGCDPDRQLVPASGLDPGRFNAWVVGALPATGPATFSEIRAALIARGISGLDDVWIAQERIVTALRALVEQGRVTFELQEGIIPVWARTN